MLTTSRKRNDLFLRNGNPSRRGFLRAGVCAGAAALANPGLGWATGGTQASEMPTFPKPPQVAVLNSKEYGLKQVQKFQDGVRGAGLDALIISNRCLDYAGYASNYHPSSMQPGVVFIPAEGNPILFVQMYSSAHARFAKKTRVDFTAGPGGESLLFYTQFGNCNFTGCAASVNSNHFLVHAGAEIRYMLWRRLFIRPEANLYHIFDNSEFHSDNVLRLGASVGFTFHRD